MTIEMLFGGLMILMMVAIIVLTMTGKRGTDGDGYDRNYEHRERTDRRGRNARD
ncbi:hypothetical protein [Sulfitobacter guttiformis]|uniref:Uncharacterized protein n=1 Tax=Sulfitobacter guttiformis TaxID=74349 RepID=A0A420DR21_9RHOB|nr:hypothetical protein [Sulfitobacter guttiformis]KIN74157.1 hypothetical protein Z949_3353 [Sulfitobacter guttiformis KCTC 32187]RKE96771.1 hypothetical protein C8N30_1341 [Sulfitobacter guttiformis]